jgi:hypothetical protein
VSGKREFHNQARLDFSAVGCGRKFPLTAYAFGSSRLRCLKKDGRVAQLVRARHS